MDIEFRIRAGRRSVADDGWVTWHDCHEHTHLITYFVDQERAAEEAVKQFQRGLDATLKEPRT